MSIGLDICKIICDRIASGAITDRLPSQSQLMSEFHVSSGTVKLALERLKQQRVIYGIKGKGTFVVQTIRAEKKTKENTIFVRLTVELLRHPFYIAFLTSLDKMLAAKGFSLEFKIQPLHDFSSNKIIFLESHLTENEKLQIQQSQNFMKAVAINCSLPGCVSILCDNVHGGYTVMETLYELGHRKIGIIAKDISIKGCFFEERLAGVFSFAEEHPDLKIAVVDMEEPDIGTGFTVMEDAVSQLFQQLSDLTAVFAFTDTFAMDFLYRYRKNEAVVGYGNSAFCSFQHPALASVDEQAEILAKKTAEQILLLHKGERPEGKIFIPSILIKRSSLTSI